MRLHGSLREAMPDFRWEYRRKTLIITFNFTVRVWAFREFIHLLLAAQPVVKRKILFFFKNYPPHPLF